MNPISIFDIFKIGIGPSSSHTLGPWKTSRLFLQHVKDLDIDKIEVRLYGSLSKTGKGHATDKAVIMGLSNYNFTEVDKGKINQVVQEVNQNNIISNQFFTVNFNPSEHIVFTGKDKPNHPNTIIYKAYKNKLLVTKKTYFSIGGGFIQDMETEATDIDIKFPYPINNAQNIQDYLHQLNISFPELVLKNELSLRSQTEITNQIQLLFSTIKDCILNGVKNTGILPGGLKVKRRASILCNNLLYNQSFKNFNELEFLVRKSNSDFNSILSWVSCFALAVNEENAAMGKVVTAPTNGAAGVVPAVLLYYYFFCEKSDYNDIEQFFLTAGELGSLFKKGATISAALGGCQAEIGVSSAMAAGALTQVLGGSFDQVMMAAEIAMEHHLGLTCDPVGGLVQIPCIERNSMGAIKAITAANLALKGNPKDCKVDLDMVIKTMWETAQNMNSKYKETSEGGLALNISVGTTEC